MVTLSWKQKLFKFQCPLKKKKLYIFATETKYFFTRHISDVFRERDGWGGGGGGGGGFEERDGGREGEGEGGRGERERDSNMNTHTKVQCNSGLEYIPSGWIFTEMCNFCCDLDREHRIPMFLQCLWWSSILMGVVVGGGGGGAKRICSLEHCRNSR